MILLLRLGSWVLLFLIAPFLSHAQQVPADHGGAARPTSQADCKKNLTKAPELKDLFFWREDLKAYYGLPEHAADHSQYLRSKDLDRTLRDHFNQLFKQPTSEALKQIELYLLEQEHGALQCDPSSLTVRSFSQLTDNLLVDYNRIAKFFNFNAPGGGRKLYLDLLNSLKSQLPILALSDEALKKDWGDQVMERVRSLKSPTPPASTPLTQGMRGRMEALGHKLDAGEKLTPDENVFMQAVNDEVSGTHGNGAFQLSESDKNLVESAVTGIPVEELASQTPTLPAGPVTTRVDDVLSYSPESIYTLVEKDPSTLTVPSTMTPPPTPSVRWDAVLPKKREIKNSSDAYRFLTDVLRGKESNPADTRLDFEAFPKDQREKLRGQIVSTLEGLRKDQLDEIGGHRFPTDKRQAQRLSAIQILSHLLEQLDAPHKDHRAAVHEIAPLSEEASSWSYQELAQLEAIALERAKAREGGNLDPLKDDLNELLTFVQTQLNAGLPSQSRIEFFRLNPFYRKLLLQLLRSPTKDTLPELAKLAYHPTPDTIMSFIARERPHLNLTQADPNLTFDTFKREFSAFVKKKYGIDLSAAKTTTDLRDIILRRYITEEELVALGLLPPPEPLQAQASEQVLDTLSTSKRNLELLNQILQGGRIRSDAKAKFDEYAKLRLEELNQLVQIHEINDLHNDTWHAQNPFSSEKPEYENPGALATVLRSERDAISQYLYGHNTERTDLKTVGSSAQPQEVSHASMGNPHAEQKPIFRPEFWEGSEPLPIDALAQVQQMPYHELHELHKLLSECKFRSGGYSEEIAALETLIPEVTHDPAGPNAPRIRPVSEIRRELARLQQLQKFFLNRTNIKPICDWISTNLPVKQKGVQDQLSQLNLNRSDKATIFEKIGTVAEDDLINLFAYLRTLPNPGEDLFEAVSDALRFPRPVYQEKLALLKNLKAAQASRDPQAVLRAEEALRGLNSRYDRLEDRAVLDAWSAHQAPRSFDLESPNQSQSRQTMGQRERAIFDSMKQTEWGDLTKKYKRSDAQAWQIDKKRSHIYELAGGMTREALADMQAYLANNPNRSQDQQILFEAVQDALYLGPVKDAFIVDGVNMSLFDAKREALHQRAEYGGIVSEDAQDEIKAADDILRQIDEMRTKHVHLADPTVVGARGQYTVPPTDMAGIQIHNLDRYKRAAEAPRSEGSPRPPVPILLTNRPELDSQVNEFIASVFYFDEIPKDNLLSLYLVPDLSQIPANQRGQFLEDYRRTLLADFNKARNGEATRFDHLMQASSIQAGKKFDPKKKELLAYAITALIRMVDRSLIAESRLAQSQGGRINFPVTNGDITAQEGNLADYYALLTAPPLSAAEEEEFKNDLAELKQLMGTNPMLKATLFPVHTENGQNILPFKPTELPIETIQALRQLPKDLRKSLMASARAFENPPRGATPDSQLKLAQQLGQDIFNPSNEGLLRRSWASPQGRTRISGQTAQRIFDGIRAGSLPPLPERLKGENLAEVVSHMTNPGYTGDNKALRDWVVSSIQKLSSHEQGEGGAPRPFADGSLGQTLSHMLTLMDKEVSDGGNPLGPTDTSRAFADESHELPPEVSAVDEAATCANISENQKNLIAELDHLLVLKKKRHLSSQSRKQLCQLTEEQIATLKRLSGKIYQVTGFGKEIEEAFFEILENPSEDAILHAQLLWDPEMLALQKYSATPAVIDDLVARPIIDELLEKSKAIDLSLYTVSPTDKGLVDKISGEPFSGLALSEDAKARLEAVARQEFLRRVAGGTLDVGDLIQRIQLSQGDLEPLKAEIEPYLDPIRKELELDYRRRAALELTQQKPAETDPNYDEKMARIQYGRKTILANIASLRPDCALDPVKCRKQEEHAIATLAHTQGAFDDSYLEVSADMRSKAEADGGQDSHAARLAEQAEYFGRRMRGLDYQIIAISDPNQKVDQWIKDLKAISVQKVEQLYGMLKTKFGEEEAKRLHKGLLNENVPPDIKKKVQENLMDAWLMRTQIAELGADLSDSNLRQKLLAQALIIAEQMKVSTTEAISENLQHLQGEGTPSDSSSPDDRAEEFALRWMNQAWSDSIAGFEKEIAELEAKQAQSELEMGPPDPKIAPRIAQLRAQIGALSQPLSEVKRRIEAVDAGLDPSSLPLTADSTEGVLDLNPIIEVLKDRYLRDADLDERGSLLAQAALSPDRLTHAMNLKKPEARAAFMRSVHADPTLNQEYQEWAGDMKQRLHLSDQEVEDRFVRQVADEKPREIADERVTCEKTIKELEKNYGAVWTGVSFDMSSAKLYKMVKNTPPAGTAQAESCLPVTSGPDTRAERAVSISPTELQGLKKKMSSLKECTTGGQDPWLTFENEIIQKSQSLGYPKQFQLSPTIAVKIDPGVALPRLASTDTDYGITLDMDLMARESFEFLPTAEAAHQAQKIVKESMDLWKRLLELQIEANDLTNCLLCPLLDAYTLAKATLEASNGKVKVDSKIKKVVDCMEKILDKLALKANELGDFGNLTVKYPTTPPTDREAAKDEREMTATEASFFLFTQMNMLFHDVVDVNRRREMDGIMGARAISELIAANMLARFMPAGAAGTWRGMAQNFVKQTMTSVAAGANISAGGQLIALGLETARNAKRAAEGKEVAPSSFRWTTYAEGQQSSMRVFGWSNVWALPFSHPALKWTKPIAHMLGFGVSSGINEYRTGNPDDALIRAVHSSLYAMPSVLGRGPWGAGVETFVRNVGIDVAFTEFHDWAKLKEEAEREGIPLPDKGDMHWDAFWNSAMMNGYFAVQAGRHAQQAKGTLIAQDIGKSNRKMAETLGELRRSPLGQHLLQEFQGTPMETEIRDYQPGAKPLSEDPVGRLLLNRSMMGLSFQQLNELAERGQTSPEALDAFVAFAQTIGVPPHKLKEKISEGLTGRLNPLGSNYTHLTEQGVMARIRKSSAEDMRAALTDSATPDADKLKVLADFVRYMPDMALQYVPVGTMNADYARAVIGIQQQSRGGTPQKQKQAVDDFMRFYGDLKGTHRYETLANLQATLQEKDPIVIRDILLGSRLTVAQARKHFGDEAVDKALDGVGINGVSRLIEESQSGQTQEAKIRSGDLLNAVADRHGVPPEGRDHFKQDYRTRMATSEAGRKTVASLAAEPGTSEVWIRAAGKGLSPTEQNGFVQWVGKALQDPNQSAKVLEELRGEFEARLRQRQEAFVQGTLPAAEILAEPWVYSGLPLYKFDFTKPEHRNLADSLAQNAGVPATSLMQAAAMARAGTPTTLDGVASQLRGAQDLFRNGDALGIAYEKLPELQPWLYDSLAVGEWTPSTKPRQRKLVEKLLEQRGITDAAQIDGFVQFVDRYRQQTLSLGALDIRASGPGMSDVIDAYLAQ